MDASNEVVVVDVADADDVGDAVDEGDSDVGDAIPLDHSKTTISFDRGR